ncbi:AraC family transcriptional regulator [Butyrivibrio sp. XPD2002]|uniref:AraC family transcriptional regulator n=1 Tax=Butyrivibrio sp. XPD2002 TaxID=1280665 RepID=UPI0003FA1C45|nr:AraC family transcriptional regulator [Butyrivibrio sp. XPD2002]
MLFCVYDPSHPVQYLSSGILVRKDGFLHERRNIDSFVLILVSQGTLHITQNGINYDVSENEAIILFPHRTHYGYKPSKGPLSYYWTHFYITDPDYHIYNQKALMRNNTIMTGLRNSYSTNMLAPSYQPEQAREAGELFVLPEYIHLKNDIRTVVLFTQLLDISRRDSYQLNWRSRYALNLLLAEFQAECNEVQMLHLDSDSPTSVRAVTEWLRTHFDEKITVADLAEQFGYNPTYLTALIKKHTGFTITELLSYYRINVAKGILSSDASTSVRRVALLCGYSDEKYFMRVFRKVAGMTPKEYREAFTEKKLVTK